LLKYRGCSAGASVARVRAERPPGNRTAGRRYKPWCAAERRDLKRFSFCGSLDLAFTVSVLFVH
jgi:hypothetical protein